MASTGEVTLGEAVSDSSLLFAEVLQVAFAGDGHIVVVEQFPPTILVFDDAGSRLSSIGRKGEGPGEFEVAPKVSLDTTGVITAWDPESRRLTWFDSTGSVRAERPVSGPLLPRFFSPQPWALAPDGAVAIVASPVPGADSELVLARTDGDVVSLATFDAVPVSLTPRREPDRARVGFSSPFLGFPRIAWSTEPFRLFVSDPNQPEVRVFDARGSSVGRFATPEVRRRPLRPEMLELARRSALESNAGLDQRELGEAYDALAHPDSVAAIGRLHWDRSGILWVERFRLDQDADVAELQGYTPAGEWVGSLSVPTSLGRVAAIDGGRIALIHRDELGVQTVRVFDLVAPEDPY